MVVLNLIILVLMIAVTAFFVASEFALVKVRSSRLVQLQQEGAKQAELALHVTHHLDAYLSASQLGITLAGLIIGWVGESAVAELLHPILAHLPIASKISTTISIILGFTIVTFVDVVVGELLPKSYSIAQTEKVVLAIVKPLHYFYKVMYPFIWLLNHAAAKLGQLFGIRLVAEGEETLTQEELLLVAVDSYKKGELTQDEYRYLENVFDFDDRLAQEIQVDRTSMEVLHAEDTVEVAIQKALKRGHTRYPVIQQSKDDILGYVTLPNLMRTYMENKDQTLVSLIEAPIVVLETLPIKMLLKMMRKERKHIAILKDEYGGTTGMVTMEDILEELVGDIRDETDLETKLIIKEADASYIISGKLTLDDFERYFKTTIPDFEQSEMSTLAGFIADYTRNQVAVGEQLTFGEFTFEVMTYEHAHIDYLRVKKAAPNRT